MIFITNQNTFVNIPKNVCTRDSLFFEAVHMALFKKPFSIPSFTDHITKTIDNVVPLQSK